MCVCGEPLISTMAFSKYEFYCLCCGRHYGFFDPLPGTPTPELEIRMEELQAEWDEIAPALIGGGQMLDGCGQCRGGEPHLRHATDAERRAYEEALELLKTRAQGAAA